jgi:hypothetical protein
MPELTDIDKAKAAVSELLKNLSIGQVFCIDDIYAQQWTIEDIQVAQLEMEPPSLLAIMPELGATIPDDRDVRRQQFRLAWQKLTTEKQSDLTKKILTHTTGKDQPTPNDYGVATTLQEIIGQGRLVALSPADWQKQEAEIVAKAATVRSLVLFDQDLSLAGGSATGGMGLIKNLLGKDTSANLLYGLLTHTATMANQHERWEELSREPGIERDRFIVVPKQWLNQDPVGFARMLKLVALSPDCQKLKTKIKTLLEYASTAASKHVDAISVFDFDHVVFRGSYDEGLWEPDVLFRLHGMFHRTELRKSAHRDAELLTLLEKLRTVSLIPTNCETNPSPSSWRLQQQDMYEPGDYINGLHLPIEVGDIFQKTDGGSTKSFVLVGQPCDLMVRSDGKRSPEITDVILLEIAPLETQKAYTEILPYFGEDRSKQHYAMFRRVHVVDPCVLDLCVFNNDGAATMDLSAVCPSLVAPAWKKRFAVARRKAESIVKRYDTFANQKVQDKTNADAVRQELIKLFPPSVSNSGVFKGTVVLGATGGRIVFNCKRVKRLCRPRAIALASQYSTCFNRPAFDRDLT